MRSEHAATRERLKTHLEWAHVRERGFYHSKVHAATSKPDVNLSIAMDGTCQMINGFPHFFETTKADAKGKRLQLHTQVRSLHVNVRAFLFPFTRWVA